MFLSQRHLLSTGIKRCLKLLLIIVVFFSHTAPATPVNIKPLRNIEKESQLASEKKLPLLILFSLTHCPYCVLIKENYLIPMLISGEYHDKVLIRELNIEEYSEVIDLSGNSIDSEQFTRNMAVSMYPTMIFVDYRGCKLAESIIGINTPSLFGGRIDDAIEEANLKIRQGLVKCN